MSQVHSAIHIRTGQQPSVELVDAWLERHAIPVSVFGDVYQACVHLLRYQDRPADLVLVGADWLVDDELDIVPYFRQTWPQAGLVVYGESRESLPPAGLPRTIICCGVTALRRLLTAGPSELLSSLGRNVGPGGLSKTAEPTPPAAGASRFGFPAVRPEAVG